MATSTPTSEIQRVRERRRAERGLEAAPHDTRAQIIEATERVLDEVPLHDITVAQLMAEAKVSRGTFYSYFESKFEVAAALLAQVMEEMYDLLRPFVEREKGVSRENAMRQVLTSSTELWAKHRMIFRVAHDHRYAVPELQAQWLEMVERFTDAIAAELKSPAARQRAAAVLWATEHLLYIAGTGVDEDLPDEKAILETLMSIWKGTL